MHKKKILLISNFENTQLYHKIFSDFENLDIYWYVVNRKNYLFLKKYYDKEKIIYINKKNFKNIQYREFNHDIKLNELISADRVLDITSNNFNYLQKVSSFMFYFLKKNKFSAIFGEFTWSYELLVYRIAKFLNISYFNLQSTRYPSNRFLFFSNERQNNFYLRQEKNLNGNFSEQTNYYEDYIKKKNLDSKNLIFLLEKGINLIFETYFDKNDPTYINRSRRVFLFLKKKFLSFLYSFIKKINISEINGDYVIYFLQKQPEATTDVKGMYYSNQYENIKMIWNVLPEKFNLIIKEHPNCIGDRSLSFYKNLLKLKNVHISDGIKFDNIIKKAKATFSIASTASLKSAIMEIPSFTFTETFFNCLEHSYRISIEDFRNCKNFFSLVEDKISLKQFDNTDFYLKNSFSGIISQEKLDDLKNLNAIKEAISEVMDKHE